MDAFNIDNVPIDYQRVVQGWAMINDKGQFQCKCFPPKPLARKSPKSQFAECTKCKLSANLEVMKAMYENGAFPNWPRMALPVCLKCSAVKLTAYENREKTGREFTASCTCKPANYYRANNGDNECWAFVSKSGANAAIDCDKACALPLVGEAAAAVSVYQEMF